MKSSIILTGEKFLGSDFRAIGPVIEDLILGAKREILIVAYIITDSTKELLIKIENSLKQNIRVKIILNQVNNKDEYVNKWLFNAEKNYDNFKLIINQDVKTTIHAKLIVADREKAVIGSANFSWGGMVKNYEIGTYIEGPDVWKLCSLIDRSFS